ncbi:putative phosphoinositide-binding protein [Cryptosporidium felis]|nr:putative phosphoinositide-binding protein [Cryptosporidium felis]
MSDLSISTKIIGWVILDGKTVYRIFVDDSTHKYEIKKRFSEFSLLQSLLVERGLGLLPSLPPKTLFKKNQDINFINERMKGLQSYLSSIISRHDVLLSPLLRNFLELPTSENKLMVTRKLVNIEMIAEIASVRQSVSGLFFGELEQTNSPILFVSHQENSVLSRLGRVWSIIDTEETGFICIWSLLPSSSNIYSRYNENNVLTNAAHNLSTSNTILASNFACLSQSGFPYKCKSILYDSKRDDLYIFSEHGTLEIFNRVFFHLKSKVSGNMNFMINEYINPLSIQLHNSLIAFVYSPFSKNNKIKHKYSLSVGIDNSIRLFCLDQMKIISGGNLNKRINGSRITSCFLEHEFGRLGFFGSTSGQLLVLDMMSQPPYLIANLNPQIDCKYPITCILISNNLLIVAYSKIIKVFKMEINPKNAHCIINDSQPLRSINVNFFSDMDIVFIRRWHGYPLSV